MSSDQDRKQARERLQAQHDNAFLRGLDGGEDAALWAAVDAVIANVETVIRAAGALVEDDYRVHPDKDEWQHRYVIETQWEDTGVGLYVSETAMRSTPWRKVATDEQR